MDMVSDTQLFESAKKIFEIRGREAFKRAETEILSNFTGDDVISEALRYFVQVTLHGALPVFPALISLSCEAVGGKTEKTTSIGAAIILIAGAADVHDDVIDRSLIKGSKRTVLGKFGKEVAILVGDALLIQGFILLQRECNLISKKQGEKILNLVAQASFEISNAEALETQLKGRLDLSPEEYFEIIKLKAAIPELNMKIGAILGSADSKTVETLGHFGRTYGILSTIAEEFMDVWEYQEFRNRLKNECPPLPFLYALQNPHVKTKVLALLKDTRRRRNNFEEITEIVLKSQQVRKLKEELSKLTQKEIRQLSFVVNDKIREELKLLLLASLEYLQGL
jgi:geranylgeranyl pyrophosphate synthase